MQFDFRIRSRDAWFCALERRPSLFLLPQHRDCGWLAWSRGMESLLEEALLVPASLLFLGRFDRILQFPRGQSGGELNLQFQSLLQPRTSLFGLRHGKKTTKRNNGMSGEPHCSERPATDSSVARASRHSRSFPSTFSSILLAVHALRAWVRLPRWRRVCPSARAFGHAGALLAAAPQRKDWMRWRQQRQREQQ